MANILTHFPLHVVDISYAQYTNLLILIHFRSHIRVFVAIHNQQTLFAERQKHKFRNKRESISGVEEAKEYRVLRV